MQIEGTASGFGRFNSNVKSPRYEADRSGRACSWSGLNGKDKISRFWLTTDTWSATQEPRQYAHTYRTVQVLKGYGEGGLWIT